MIFLRSAIEPETVLICFVVSYFSEVSWYVFCIECSQFTYILHERDALVPFTRLASEIDATWEFTISVYPDESITHFLIDLLISRVHDFVEESFIEGTIFVRGDVIFCSCFVFLCFFDIDLKSYRYIFGHILSSCRYDTIVEGISFFIDSITRLICSHVDDHCTEVFVIYIDHSFDWCDDVGDNVDDMNT